MQNTIQQSYRKKIKRGMKESRIKGNYTGGRLLYGYSVEDKKVVINEDEAEVVRYIFKQYSMGIIVPEIIASLNAKGILNRGRPFVKNTIYYLLKNERYAGVYRFKDEVYLETYPKIVPDDVYDTVRKKVEGNRYGKQSREVVYLLKNKVKCGYCGSTMTGVSGTSSSGTVNRYYQCNGKKNHNGCTKELIRKDYIEEFIVNNIISYLSQPAELVNMTQAILEIQENNLRENANQAKLMKEKQQCQLALDNVMKAVEQGVINNTTGKRMNELESRIADIEQQLKIEQNKIPIKVSQENILEFYTEAIRLEANMMINCLVKEIRIYDDKVEIQFNNQ